MAIMSTSDFFDELEIMSPEARKEYLDQRLSQTIDHAYCNAPAAKAILDRAGVTPADIRTVKDLEKLSVTRKMDLIELQQASPPFGGFLAIPIEDVDRIFIPPGPAYEPHFAESIKWFAKSFYAGGFRKGDIVINSFTYHMSPAGMVLHESLRACGATPIAMGTGNTDMQIQAMLHLKVNGFIGTPSFLMTIIKQAEQMRHDFCRDFNLQRAWFTGEMLPPSLRKVLEEDYHINTSQAYAVTDTGGAVAYECLQKSGMHLMDEYLMEIVDHETGKQLGPGEIGEIVVTPLHNQTWGLIRFGTGDLSTYITEPCPCGRTANRLVSIVGRTGDAVKVRGMFVVAKQAEQALLAFDEVSRFQLIVGRKGQRDELILNVELEDEAIDRDRLSGELSKEFQSVCRVKLDDIKFVPKGTIPEQRQTIADE
ncbi:MAG: AMP-binding protein, partial [Chloroflexi bacterium]|nr:AMP-binding protein [Chloroflexota bacterium]